MVKSIRHFHIAVGLGLWVFLLAPPALAEDTGDSDDRARPAEPPSPQLVHAPVSVAQPHRDLVIEAKILHPDRVRRAILLYRTSSGGPLIQREFRRGGEQYVGVIPAKHVKYPGVAYAIELELVADGRQRVFASRDRPHQVSVSEDLFDVRERAQLERLGGRRSVVSFGGEFVSFGTSDVNTPGQADVDDGYWGVNAGYTYRLLRTVNEFGVNFGLVRGSAPVETSDSSDPAVASEDFDPDVGLNYARPRVRFRLSDSWHLEPSFVVSVTEVGFAMGAGAKLHVGDPYGAKLVLGAEVIDRFGVMVFSRVDLLATERVTVSPIIEVTDTPNAERFGVRLLGEVNVQMGRGFALAARGGYQARDSTSGGPSAGGDLSYAF